MEVPLHTSAGLLNKCVTGKIIYKCESKANYRKKEHVTKHINVSANHACLCSVQMSKLSYLLTLKLQTRMILTWQPLCVSMGR
jgi:hypothetical protein